MPHDAPPRRVRAGQLLLVLASPLLLLALVATVFYALGNGLTLGTLALATVPVLLWLVPRAVAYPTRRTLAVTVAVLAMDAAYAAWRVAGVVPEVCVDGVCGQDAPLLARLVREDETAYAGIALSEALGLLGADERAVLEPVARESYAELDRRRRGRPGPNGLFLSSDPSRVTELVWMPPGEAKVPAIVFLHGFGGQLTPCVTTLARSELGERFAVVAPALDMAGYWWEPRGRAVLARTLETLPPRVDRERLWLMGLSNGAIGASHLGFDPELGPRFRGTVLLVGADLPWEGDLARGRVLLVPGLSDPRFPYSGIEAAAEAMRARGVDVTTVPVAGDHFVLLTEPDAVTGAVVRWLDATPPTTP